MSYCFRPLSGSYISQFSIQSCACLYRIGFRPLSGSYISQLKDFLLYILILLHFRPLSGSYISQYKRGGLKYMNEKFPSPIGELHFSISRHRTAKVLCLYFRPLSGSYISQSYDGVCFWHRYSISVPYRGATFLNKALLLV